MNEKHPLPVDMRHFLQTILARLHIPEETSYPVEFVGGSNGPPLAGLRSLRNCFLRF